VFRLFRRKSKVEVLPIRQESIYARGDGEYAHEIVGESFYQDALYQIAGKKKEQAKEIFIDAFLVCESNNPHDERAVAVRVRNSKVGHLSRNVNYSYRQALSRVAPDLPAVRVAGVIVGGWKDDRSEGHYGVFLDMEWPYAFETV